MNMPKPASRLNLTTLILIAAVAAAAGLWVGNRYFGAPEQPRMATALLYPEPRPLPEFTLAQANGQPLTLADWRGHWSIVYFGYASCPRRLSDDAASIQGGLGRHRQARASGTRCA